MPNNRTLTAWFGGTEEGKEDVAIWIADRFCGRWSKPRQIAKTKGMINWNPVLFLAPDGVVHLFYKGGKNVDTWQTWTINSQDDGATWSAPCLLVAHDSGGRGPVKNKPIVLSNGTWLAPASLEKDGQWDAFVDSSEDGGINWQASDIIEINRREITCNIY